MGNSDELLPPERIWLLRCEGLRVGVVDDHQRGNDVEYVRADLCTPLVQVIEEVERMRDEWSDDAKACERHSNTRRRFSIQSQAADKILTRLYSLQSAEKQENPYAGIPKCTGCGQLLSPHCEACQPYPASALESEKEKQ